MNSFVNETIICYIILMAHSYSEQIRINEKNIAQTKENLANNYKSLGKNIALFVCDNSFSYCLRELSSYEIAKGEYKRLLNKKNKLKSKVHTLDDNNNEIYNLRKSLTEYLLN
jgi:DNA repair ATPase RecN